MKISSIFSVWQPAETPVSATPPMSCSKYSPSCSLHTMLVSSCTWVDLRVFAPSQELHTRFFSGTHFIFLSSYQSLKWLYNLSSKLGILCGGGTGGGGWVMTQRLPQVNWPVQLTYVKPRHLSTSISNLTSPQKFSDSLALCNHFLFLEQFCVIAKHTKVSIVRERPESQPFFFVTVWSAAGRLSSGILSPF